MNGSPGPRMTAGRSRVYLAVTPAAYPACHPLLPPPTECSGLWYASGIWRRLHDHRLRETRDKEPLTDSDVAVGRAERPGVRSATERGRRRLPAIPADRAQSMVPSDRRAVLDGTYVIHPNRARLAVQAKSDRI